MRVAFRVDAAAHIGFGHVMRCSVLASELRQHGAEVVFICRPMRGDMIQRLREDSFQVVELPRTGAGLQDLNSDPWLRVPSKLDAEQTVRIIRGMGIDCLVLDSYGIDNAWEAYVSPYSRKLFVIDDLANRSHQCDILLDQNLKPAFESAYRSLVSSSCRQLLGPGFALVRPEFAQVRQESLNRRQGWQMDRLLVSLGGSDPEDETSKVIISLKQRALTWRHIDVVVGAAYAGTARLKELLADCPAELHVQTPYMAQLMANADIAVTGGGSTSWEKCALGLPSVAVVLADNQRPIATALHACGAQITVDSQDYSVGIPYGEILESVTSDTLNSMSNAASRICDGLGAHRVRSILVRELA